VAFLFEMLTAIPDQLYSGPTNFIHCSWQNRIKSVSQVFRIALWSRTYAFCEYLIKVCILRFLTE